jgi:hypothetical protein
MVIDETEPVRRELVAALDETASGRLILESRYGQVWSTEQLTDDFEVLGFLAPFVVVRRRSDNQKGSLMFQRHPRFYFSFKPD